jgi:hypothetical protein
MTPAEGIATRASIKINRSAYRRSKSEASSQFAKRNKPACSFIPKHEANASKALTHSGPADLRKIGVAAKHKRQSIKRDSAAEVVDMVHPDIGGEPAQYDRQVIM